MLLFAYIMFVLATAPALKVAGVTAMSVVSIWKQGESGTSTSWLGAGPGASRAGFHPALAAGICLCPRCPWQEPAKRFMVLFIYLLLIDLFVCRCWAATQSLPSNLWHPQHLLQGLFPHPRAFLTPRCLPRPWLPLPTSQRDSRPLPASPKFLCSSCHLPLGVSISFLTPGLPCWLQDGLSLWLYLCGSVIATSLSGKC